jgi:hypothetical protein
MICVCGHDARIHRLSMSGTLGFCWANDCGCLCFKHSTLGGSGNALPDRAAPTARSTPAETAVAKSSASSVATDESPARSRTACAAGSSLCWEDVRDAVDREMAGFGRRYLRQPVERPWPSRQMDGYRVGWLAQVVANFLNNHPEYRAELLPELDPETTETTW